MDPPTHFHSNLGFLEKKILCKAPKGAETAASVTTFRHWVLSRVGKEIDGPIFHIVQPHFPTHFSSSLSFTVTCNNYKLLQKNANSCSWRLYLHCHSWWCHLLINFDTQFKLKFTCVFINVSYSNLFHGERTFTIVFSIFKTMLLRQLAIWSVLFCMAILLYLVKTMCSLCCSMMKYDPKSGRGRGPTWVWVYAMEQGCSVNGLSWENLGHHAQRCFRIWNIWYEEWNIWVQQC